MAVALGVLIVVAAYSLSFVVTAGITFVIFQCFGLAWSWAIALGIWLVLVLIRLFFANSGGRS